MGEFLFIWRAKQSSNVDNYYRVPIRLTPIHYNNVFPYFSIYHKKYYEVTIGLCNINGIYHVCILSLSIIRLFFHLFYVQ